MGGKGKDSLQHTILWQSVCEERFLILNSACTGLLYILLTDLIKVFTFFSRICLSFEINSTVKFWILGDIV